MNKMALRVALATGLLLFACSGAVALNSTCETRNQATFETLGEAHQSSPAVVRTYEGNNIVDPATKRPRAFAGLRRWTITRKGRLSYTARQTCTADARRRD